MALTESTMMALGTQAPDFALPDAGGKVHRLSDFADAPALLVVFMCNHCPYVRHIREGFADFARRYAARGLAVVAINSNDLESHPEDGPDAMREEARRYGYVFPYLLDESQEIAKAYRAACTPDFFLFDSLLRLVYRGQFDASRPGNDIPVTGKDLAAAVEATLAGKPVPGEQKPSVGCNIKWKAGNEPAYYTNGPGH